VKFVLILALLIPGVCYGQTVEVQGGLSQLLESSGGSVKVYGTDGSISQFGIGNIEGGPTLYGGSVTKPFGDGFVGTAGDQFLNFGVPTDLAPSQYGFAARGFLIGPKQPWGTSIRSSSPISGSFEHELASVLDGVIHRCKIFAGVSSSQYGVGWFTASKASNPLGSLNCRGELTGNFALTFLGAYSNRQTSILGLVWHSGDFTVSGAGGIGDNSPFGAALASFENSGKTFEARIGYASVSDDFRRVLSNSPSTLVSTNQGLNGDAAWILRKRFRVSGSHQKLLSPILSGLPLSADVNTGSAFLSLGSLGLHSSYFESATSSGVKNSGQVYGATYKLTSSISLQGDELRARGSDVLISSIKERLRRFEFIESYSRSTSDYPGQPVTNAGTFQGGVSYRNGNLSAELGFTEMYFPWLVGKSPFQRVLTISFAKAIRDTTISASNYFSPEQKMRFSVGMSQYIYGRPVDGRKNSHQSGRSLDKYVVRGRVVEIIEGKQVGVFGAAIQMDSQAVFTDFSGDFFIRFRKPAQMPVCVPTGRFLTGDWRLVSITSEGLPVSTVQAQLEDHAGFIVVVVKRCAGSAAVC
jgi:hypothetical protein